MISGTAGVGKTVLAVHWARQVAERFPDGRLYVNLRGFDPDDRALDPDDVLCGFLAAFGMSRYPGDLAGHYRRSAGWQARTNRAFRPRLRRVQIIADSYPPKLGG